MQMFDITQFLEEQEFEFRGDVTRMRLDVGWLVPGGKKTKFWVVENADDEASYKKEALAYAEQLKKETGKRYFTTGGVQQTWFMTECLSSPWSADGFPVTSFANSDDPIWNMLKSQWAGDDPPLSQEDFGKDVWVHFVYRPHPEFDPDNPNNATTQVESSTGSWQLDEEGKPRPRMYRIVVEKVGTTEEEARKWFDEMVESDAGAGAEFEKEVNSLMPDSWVESGFQEDAWLDTAIGICRDFQDGKKLKKLEKDWAEFIDKNTLEKLAELAEKAPSLPQI